jgi:branched-chain amino acid transport system substrate-binding protein
MHRALVLLAVLLLPVAALAAEPLRIGVLNDQSGIYADIAGPGSVTAARMAAEDFGGTVLGRPIEVLAGDHQNKPDIGSAIARKWYDRDGVGLIVDLPTSSVVLAVNEVARARHKLLIVTTGGTSSLTGKYCAPQTFHWVYDTYGLAAGTATALVTRGQKVWAFLTADYEFGKALEQDTTAALQRAGGRVVASIRHPQGTTDFSSYLLQLQGSGAQVIGLANAGSDTINAVKQAQEFGLTSDGKQQLAGLFLNLSDIHALGLAAAHGLLLTQGFYWNLDGGTRAFARRYFDRQHAMPSQGQAGTYSAVTHYLKAVQAAGTDNPVAVATRMRAMPVDDFFARGARLRVDGKLAHELYLLQVKEPAEQTEPWDYLKLIATIPPGVANRPLAEGGCPLVKPVHPPHQTASTAAR